MKKILLSVLFMSLFSIAAFAGEQQQMNECNFGVVSEPHSPINPNIRRVTAFIDMTQYETCGDFVAAMRNTMDPESGLPYIEGALQVVIINNDRTIPLNAHLADFNISPRDYFHILSLVAAHQPVHQVVNVVPAHQPIHEEEADLVDLLDDSGSDDEDYAYGNG